jgi:RimJ/RimL family protein N-acetyltransferase
MTDIISTNRLTLRSACNTDLETLYDIVFSVAEVMAQAFEGNSLTKDKAMRFFADHFDRNGNGRQLGVLTLRDSGNIIGFAGLLECSALGERDYEIGFVLGREFWGKGYATEIGRGQIEYGLEVAGCKRLLALVSPGNNASIAVLKKIGMTHHSTIETDTRGKRQIYVAQGHG